MAKRVTAGKTYVYRPTGYDLFDSRTDASAGQLVTVKNMPGAPPANTMGHCHVVDAETGRFLGLVLTASLDTPKRFRSPYDGKTYIDEIEAKRAEYEAETGERPSRAVAEVILDREADARNSAF